MQGHTLFNYQTSSEHFARFFVTVTLSSSIWGRHNFEHQVNDSHLPCFFHLRNIQLQHFGCESQKVTIYFALAFAHIQESIMYRLISFINFFRRYWTSAQSALNFSQLKTCCGLAQVSGWITITRSISGQNVGYVILTNSNIGNAINDSVTRFN